MSISADLGHNYGVSIIYKQYHMERLLLYLLDSLSDIAPSTLMTSNAFWEGVHIHYTNDSNCLQYSVTHNFTKTGTRLH